MYKTPLLNQIVNDGAFPRTQRARNADGYHNSEMCNLLLVTYELTNVFIINYHTLNL